MQVLPVEVRLVVEQDLVHLPELALRARAFGRLRRAQRIRMDFLDREVAIGEPDPAFEMLQQ